MQITYIAGWGRSGSTLIGGMLGDCDQAVYIGELWNLWEDYHKPENHCSCGQPYAQCPFWSQVIAEAGLDGAAIRDLYQTKLKFLGTRSLGALSRNLKDGETDDALEAYRTATGNIYDAIGRLSGANHIVDASKTPNLLGLLQAMPGLNARILHIVRDPRAVAYSWWYRTKARGTTAAAGTMAQHSPVRSTASWLARNRGVEQMAEKTGLPYMRLRYEDFVAAPGDQLALLKTFAGIQTQERSVHPQSHSIRGNPIRFSADVRTVKADDEWKSALPWHFRLAIKAMAGGMMHRYGYF